MNDLPTIFQPITKAIAFMVQLDAPLRAVWFVVMLALLCEYFALFQHPANET